VQIPATGKPEIRCSKNFLRDAHKKCIAMSVTLGKACVQKIAEDTIGAELVQKML